MPPGLCHSTLPFAWQQEALSGTCKFVHLFQLFYILRAETMNITEPLSHTYCDTHTHVHTSHTHHTHTHLLTHRWRRWHPPSTLPLSSSWTQALTSTSGVAPSPLSWPAQRDDSSPRKSTRMREKTRSKYTKSEL